MKEIHLTKGYVALVDDEDYERVNALKWHVYTGKNRKTPYAIHTYRSEGKCKSIFMHRFVLWLADSTLEIDHRNHNGLDNQKHNLRPCTHRENMLNGQRVADIHPIGIVWIPSRQKWRAKAQVNGKMIQLGEYQEQAHAAKAYDAFVKLLGQSVVADVVTCSGKTILESL